MAIYNISITAHLVLHASLNIEIYNSVNKPKLLIFSNVH